MQETEREVEKIEKEIEKEIKTLYNQSNTFKNLLKRFTKNYKEEKNKKEDRFKKNRKYLLTLLVSGTLLLNSTITGFSEKAFAQEFSTNKITRFQVTYHNPIYIDPFLKTRVSKIFVETIDTSGMGFPVDNITSEIESSLSQKGYLVTDTPEKADLILRIYFDKFEIKQNEIYSGSGRYYGRTIGNAAGYEIAKPGYEWGISEALKSIGRQIISDIGEKTGEKIATTLKKEISGIPFRFYGSIKVELIEIAQSRTLEKRGYYSFNGEGLNYEHENFLKQVTDETLRIIENSIIKPLEKPQTEKTQITPEKTKKLTRK